MEENIKILNRKRGALKTKLTNFRKFLELFIDKDKVDKSLYIELKTRIARIDSILGEFEEINNEILVVDEHFDTAVKEQETFETEFYHLKSKADLLVAEFYNKFDYDVGSENNSDPGSSSKNSAVVTQTKVQLPAIPIPTFSGKVEDWLEFKDMFLSLVHDNETVSNVEKFHFLKKAVQGEALKLVQSRQMTSENYTIVWQLLCDRYNDLPMLVEYHLDALLNIPTVQRESASDLLRMSDTLTEALYHLEKLGVSVQSWDPFLIHLLVKKLDQNSFLKWEERRPKGQLATLDLFKDFLSKRVDNLKNIERKRKTELKSEIKKDFKFNNKFQKSLVSTDSFNCVVCKNNHQIFECQKYLKMKTYSRYDLAKRLGLCLNCLKKVNHISKSCEAPGCNKCGKLHHYLLHYEPRQQNSGAGQSEESGSGQLIDQGNLQVTSVFLDNGEEVQGEVFLTTALVRVQNRAGEWHTCRALLDSGSQPNLVTRELVDKLQISTVKIDVSISGVGDTSSRIGQRCLINLKSNYKDFDSTVSCLVVDKITGLTPSHHVPVSNLVIPRRLRLADPNFNKPQSVDLLLGANIFYSLLCMGQFSLGQDQPMLQESKLGWLITGSLVVLNRPVTNLFTGLLSLQDQLRSFWEIDEISVGNSSHSIEKEKCEQVFKESTIKGEDGKFIVRLPLSGSISKLGNSYDLAVRRFFALERKLKKNLVMNKMYNEFMEEYHHLGHMSLVNSRQDGVSFYLPHHGVLKESSETTKLRVVFDGSAKSDTGVSINDLQCNGPKQQDDLFDILIRFRQHQIVVCGDVEKMYRMVWVAPDQRRLQKIIWRFSSEDPIQEWTLNTVTYGTKAAPYLAVRCLRQLALDNTETYPEASKVILRDFYVDDLLTGAETSTSAVNLCQEVAGILSSGGMNLRKWVSNDIEVQKNLSNENTKVNQMEFGEKDKNKTLGLWWHFQDDNLKFLVEFSDQDVKVSKRSILSEISKIFDPLGLVSPIVILAKILIQKLWLEKLDWDTHVPLNLRIEWEKIKTSMVTLNNVIVPRKVIVAGSRVLEIHGFCDASMQAYGACIYVRSVSATGHVTTGLLCSKTRVSPLKKLTIPRLELCGALVLAELVNKVKQAFIADVTGTFFWCDSMVVLGWVGKPAHSLQQFVGNRISKIQELSNPVDWNYVKSEENPADILSRGMNSAALVDCSKWWNGPHWLGLDQSQWPLYKPEILEELPEMKVQLTTCPTNDTFHWDNFSNLNRLLRALCYIFRFVNKFKNNKKIDVDFITSGELEFALMTLVKVSQRESFSQIITDLSNNKPVKDNGVLHLAPFLDNMGYLRVGGRLQLASVGFSKKHPFLLSAKHRFSLMLVEMMHKRLLHAGPQLLLCSLREKFWIIGGRNLVRRIVRTCVTCFKSNPIPCKQIMGVLPEERVNGAPPFYITGVDYAGPLNIKNKVGRGAKTTKCYICIFICCATKALHIELVSNLSSATFIAAFRRFVSRRGKPFKMLSDNGTNFVGANAELKELASFLKSQSDVLSTELNNEGINWSFIPPNSPNFGGLWEAGVRSCKMHLKRIMGNSIFTFEELCTVLTQIEALLNSRPLVPLSSNPNDLDALTPAHFLIGRRLTSVPDPDVTHIPTNRLSRYQLMQSLVQHFWKRWSKEYLCELQIRHKWKKEEKNLQVGELVILKEDNLPPSTWLLGRIIETFQGPDSRVRVVSIKTMNGEYKRAVSKVCPLPINNDNVN